MPVILPATWEVNLTPTLDAGRVARIDRRWRGEVEDRVLRGDRAARRREDPLTVRVEGLYLEGVGGPSRGPETIVEVIVGPTSVAACAVEPM